MNDLDKYFKIATEINDKVASFLLSKFGSLKEITHKSDSHYGIAEDKESNEMYEDYLKDKTPEVALFTEEGERNLESDWVWIIDPIEGTSNYRAGNPFWATQIGLLYKNEPVVAIINVPFLKQKFWATKESGAYLNGNKINGSELTDLKKALIDLGRGTTDADKDWLVKTIGKVSKCLRATRYFGSTGLGISYTAAGITDIYLNSGSHIYDYVPGALVAKEAGLEVLNMGGTDWKVGDKGILVSNQKLAEDLLKIIV